MLSAFSASCVITLKQAQFAWRKVCLEFQKRIDCDLPFYYFTSAHDRFYEGARPSFDEPSKKVKKKRLPRAEQAVSVSSGRATLPVRGTLTIRPQFHKHPVSVPVSVLSLVNILVAYCACVYRHKVNASELDNHKSDDG